MPAADAVIRFDGVTHRFSSGGREHVALSAIDLRIPSGQFVALVGASGCGKTTLLNMIAGLVRASTGDVLLNGHAPTCPDADIGYMFARDALLPWRTARRNVELPLEARGVRSSARRARAEEMLTMVGLAERQQYFPLQLSQGMRQRVALARTLAPGPQILLMDEPFAALDARTKLDMQAEFLRIWEGDLLADGRTAKTVVFVTHDLQEAAMLADRVIVMLPSPGRIAADRMIDLPRPRAGSIGELMFDPGFRAISRDLFEQLEGALPVARDRRAASGVGTG